jgi:hypothetical protein
MNEDVTSEMKQQLTSEIRELTSEEMTTVAGGFHPSYLGGGFHPSYPSGGFQPFYPNAVLFRPLPTYAVA